MNKTDKTHLRGFGSMDPKKARILQVKGGKASKGGGRPRKVVV